MKIKSIKLIRVPQFLSFLISISYKDWGMRNECVPPLGLGIMSSYLRSKGINIEQDDLDIKLHYDNWHYPEKYISAEVLSNSRKEITGYLLGQPHPQLDRISKELASKTDLNFDLILISCLAPADAISVGGVFLLSKYIKENYNSIIVVGGSGVNIGKEDWLLLMKLKIIDFIVKGSGEISLFKLIAALRNDEDLSGVPGLIYMEDNKLLCNEPLFKANLNVVPDFDGLPLKRYHFNVPLLDKYVSKPVKDIFILPLVFIISCKTGKCIFCYHSTQDCQYLSPVEAVDMIQELSEKYRTRYFFFINTQINISKRYVNQFCDEIIRRNLNIYWMDCAHFDGVDKETLIKLRRAGAIKLVWGLETGSPRILKYINKGVILEQASEILKISHEVGIWNGLEIISGFPLENEEDVQMTLNFLNKNRAYIDIVYASAFRLGSNTPLWKFPERYGITNVRETDRIDSQKKVNPLEDISEYMYSGHAFDEVNGLKWEEKKRQIIYSLNKVIDQTNPHLYNGYNETIVILFYLYTIFKDKKQIREVYNRWIKDKKGQTVFSQELHTQ